MKNLLRRGWAVLSAGLGAALLALPAHADVFQFEWAHKWAAGHIIHATDIADSDPSSFRDVFVGAIGDYSFYSFSIDELRPILFSGSGGTLEVEHVRARPGVDGCPDSGVIGCVADRFTFLLGSLEAPVRLVAITWLMPYGGVAGPPSRWPVDAAWSAPVNGVIHSGFTPSLGAMNEISFTNHVRLYAPVPEPASLLLLATGLALLASTGTVRRRSGCRR